ncbi:MAG TPA: PAS domain-containing sensor histidine kinase [Cytophagaceae bacterium]|jgi:PAS domain S-box-containing protein|nr:PAS domain-containing sensor histidine kinase [Cytophagaceae bacterium]
MQLADSNSRLKAIIDNAVDGIITIDSRGIIESANPAAARLFGYTHEEMMGKNVKMLMPEPDKSNHDQYIKNYQRTGIGSIIGKGREVIGKRKDGSTFPFLLSISEVELSGGKMYTGIIHDISELEEMKNALKKEMELNELKSRFVTMASHEFRTPLSAILSSASLISKYNDPKDEDKRLKHIHRIKSSVANLTSILNDFLSISKLEEGKVLNTPVALEITDLCNEIIEEMSPVLKEEQVIQYKHYGDTKVHLDKNIIKNICINLLSNAIKYSSEGKNVEFTTSNEKGMIDIVVKDYGIGIPDGDKQHLFSRFFRAHNAGNIQGTGLGLNIVKKYIDLMNGEIYFTSELNKGTVFTVTVPCQKETI